MNLEKLLKKVYINEHLKINHEVKDVVNNSMLVKDDFIFVCIKGNKLDGHDFIEDAISKGCKTIIYESDIVLKDNINYIKVSDTKKVYSMLIHTLYKKYLKNKEVIGVTGTNGKTTISNMIYEFYKYMDKDALLISTNKIITKDKVITTNNTTPDIKMVYECFLMATKLKIKYIIIEISSIAIKELRLYKIDFNQLIFSNITHDHLDYHKNFTDYLYSKALVFCKMKDCKNNFVVLNKDCISYDTLVKLSDCKVFSYSKDLVSDILINDFKCSFNINYDFTYTINTNLIAEFNIYNVLAFLTYAINKGFMISDVLKFLKTFKSVKGRMDIIKKNNKYIVIDYAHTPDGILQVIKTFNSLFSEVYVLLGMGGDRDNTKREVVGRILDSNAYKIYLTNDNPRSEDENKIIEDILKGIKREVFICLDRKECINKAFNDLKENQVLLILGKGNEEYQEIMGKKIKYSDYDVVNKL